MGHAALTDLETKRHRFSEVLYREVPLLAGYGAFPEPRIGWSRAPAGTDDLWSLDWSGEGFDFAARDESEGFGFRLSTLPKKPLVFQGPGGFSRKGEGERAASHYYSFTRLETKGVVELEGKRFEVTGELDGQGFSSSQLAENQVGWDWFSLRLDDGRDSCSTSCARSGAVDYANGPGRCGRQDGYLDRSAFRSRCSVIGQPATSARYPSKWRIRSRDSISSSSAVPDQENRSRLPEGLLLGGRRRRRDADGGVGSRFVE
jgi:predicted secreted hydrolase